jgi:hypothetical protein
MSSDSRYTIDLLSNTLSFAQRHPKTSRDLMAVVKRSTTAIKNPVIS